MNGYLKFVGDSKVDLTDWEFNCSFGDLDLSPAICSVVAEGINEQFTENPPYLSLPHDWMETGGDGNGGAPVSDPLTIYLNLPFPSLNCECVMSTSLVDMLSIMMGDLDNSGLPKDGGYIDPEPLRNIAAALRAQADRLDAQAVVEERWKVSQTNP
jgi:hypothetical protein